MLVLSRKECETVVIGDNIRVTVLHIEGRNIRLGFEAPKDIEIHREEVYNEIQKKKGKVIESDSNSET